MSKSTYYRFFSNLSNELRMDIINILKDYPRSVNEISNSLKIEQSKISHALQYLKCCNIVISKQVGKNRIYSLNKKTIIPILKIIDKHAQIYCNGKCNCGVK